VDRWQEGLDALLARTAPPFLRVESNAKRLVQWHIWNGGTAGRCCHPRRRWTGVGKLGGPAATVTLADWRKHRSNMR
jgi:hypothetical protein